MRGGPTTASVTVLARRGGAHKLERMRALVFRLGAHELELLEQLVEQRRAELALERDDELLREQIAGREIVDERPRTGGGSFRLEFVRCGKTRCKCAADYRSRRTAQAFAALHGPYWYAYVPSRGGRVAHRYVGKPGSAAAVAAGLS